MHLIPTLNNNSIRVVMTGDDWRLDQVYIFLHFINAKQRNAVSNKNLSRCWDSVTCKPLYAEILSANVTFFIPHWSSSVEFQITGYYDPGRLCMPVAKTPTYMSRAHFHFCSTVWSQSTNVTDRQTDGRQARSISVKRVWRVALSR